MKCCFLSIFVFIAFGGQTVNSQVKRSQAIFIELKGSGINLTLNYDTRFSRQPNGIGGTAGFGYFGDKYQNAMNVPASINYLMGTKNSFLELGIGMVWSDYTRASDDQEGFAEIYLTKLQGWAFSVITGYRYQQAGRFLFGIAATPTISKNKIYPLAGLSLGYSF